MSIDPKSYIVATGSMDHTARLWDMETGKCLEELVGHQGEVISLHFQSDSHKLLTGSFD